MRPDSFIITRKDDIHNLTNMDILNKYAIKDDPRQLKEEIDGFGNEDVLIPLYDPSELNKLLELNIWHERCVDAISRDSTGQGYDISPRPGIEKPDPENKKILEEFFNNLRPSINDLLYKKMYDRQSNGNGAWEIIREEGQDTRIKDIKHVPSHTLRKLKDGIRVVQKVGMKKVYFVLMDKNKDENNNYYNIDYKTGEKTGNRKNRANELIWSKTYTPRSNYYGVSKIIPSIRTIHGDIYRANYNSSFFKNYGMPAYAVIITGDFDPGPQPGEEDYDKKQTLKYKIQEQLKELIRNPYSALTIMIPSEDKNEGQNKVDVKLEPLSVDIKEASFRLYRKDNRDEIIASHGVDPNRLGITETGKLNGSNSSELDNSYKTSLINPLKRENEDEINHYIIKKGFGINDWVFTIIDNDPFNIQKDVTLITELVEKGIITPNEAREYLGEYFNLKNSKDMRLDEYYYNGQILGENQLDEETLLDNNDTRDNNDSSLKKEGYITKIIKSFKN